jgi:hypothetical protein
VTYARDLVLLTKEEAVLHGIIGHILHRNCLLKYVVGGETEGGRKQREDEEEDISSYLMTLKKREDTGNLKRKH